MTFPTRSETRGWLVRLATGEITPRAASDWAVPFVVDEATHPDAMDDAVWEAIGALAGADLEAAPGVYLHSPEDYADWLHDFDQASSR